MLAAMHLAVLMSLFAVTTCADSTISPAPTHTSEVTTTAGHTRSTVTEVVSSSEKITTNTPQHPTTTAHVAVTSKNASSSTPPSTFPQTPNRTEETHPSQTPETTVDHQTSNETVSQGVTLTPASESSNVTAIMINTTSTVFPREWEKGNLAENPGLVAILCIFCITLVLVLVVATVKCIQSPKSNFERLEDVPMGNMNEKSPFAQYSK